MEKFEAHLTILSQFQRMEKNELLHLNDAVSYQKWRKWLHFTLLSKGLEKFLDETADDEKPQEVKSQAKVMAMLYKTVDTKFTDLFINLKNPKSAIKALDEAFEFNKFENVEEIQYKLENITYHRDLKKLLTYIRKLISQYKNAGGDLSDHQISRLILKVFPDSEFKTVKLYLKKEAHENENKYVLANVLKELEAFTPRKYEKSSRNVNNYPKKNYRTFHNNTTIICRNCGESGHKSFNCRNKKKLGVFCYKCGLDGHKANNCNNRSYKSSKANYSRNRNSDQNRRENPNDGRKNQENAPEERSQWLTIVNANHSENESDEVTFCLDSGSTSNCVADRSLMKDVEQIENYEFSNSFGEKDKGNLCGKVFAQLESGKSIVISNVLYSRRMATNLISVHALTQNGFKVVFEKDRGVIYNQRGEIECIAPFNGKYYQIVVKVERDQDDGKIGNKSANQSIMSEITMNDVWHARMGHISEKYLKETDKCVHGINLKNYEHNFCYGCKIGKFKRDPVRKQMKYENEVIEPKDKLDKLCLDVVGPFEVRSKDGYKGFVSVTDAFTRYRWIVLIESRAEVGEKLIKLFNKLQNRYKSKIKCLRSDQGSEFVNKRLRAYCEENGITVEYSAVYTPEENGISERSNGLIQEGLRSMLLISGLGKKYWSFAAMTKVHSLNRTFCKPIGKTPLEALTGRKPSVKKMRIFGSKGFALDVGPKTGKLNKRGIPVIMLGYAVGEPGYQVLNLDSNKIQITRNATFDEHQYLKDVIMRQNAEKSSKSRNKHIASELKQNNEKRSANRFKMLESEDDEDIELEVENEVEYETLGPGRNYLEIHDDNIIGNRNEGIKTRNQRKQFTKSCTTNCLHTIYQNKVETIVKPKRYSELENRNDGQLWKEAYDKEIKKFEEIAEMKLVKRPKDKQVLPILELYTQKFDNIKQKNIYKCRFVIRGDLERNNKHRNTYAPVVGNEVSRVFFALCAQFGWNIRQCDVSAAFLYGSLDREIYIELPQKLKMKYAGQNLCWCTRKSVYGLIDAPRSWNCEIRQFLMKFGFKQCPVEESLYIYTKGDIKVILIVYVDDICYAGNETKMLDKFEMELSKLYEVKYKLIAEDFIGFEIKQSANGIIISQKGYIAKLVETFEMSEANVKETPMETMLVIKDDENYLEDIKLYQSLIGGLLYLQQKARPDISYAVNQLSKFAKKPTMTHLKYGKRVLKYLKAKANYGIMFKKCERLNIQVFIDSEHGRHSGGKSVYGFVIMFNNAPVMYQTKQMDTASLSSTESEFKAIAESMKKVIWMRNVLRFLEVDFGKISIWNDNMGAIKIAKSAASCGRTKHIDLRYFFVREILEQNDFELDHVAGDVNIADTFTKSLGKNKFNQFMEMLMKPLIAA